MATLLLGLKVGRAEGDFMVAVEAVAAVTEAVVAPATPLASYGPTNRVCGAATAT